MTNVKLDKHPLPIGVKNVKNSNSDFPTRPNVSLFFNQLVLALLFHLKLMLVHKNYNYLSDDYFNIISLMSFFFL